MFDLVMFWDDPNGFSMFISFLIPFIFTMNKKKFTKFVLISLMLACILLTQSLTGIFCFVVSLVLGISSLAILNKKSKGMLFTIMLVCMYTVAGVSLYRLVLNLSFVKQYIEIKSNSADMHLNSLDVIKESTLTQLLGLSPRGSYGESGIINMLLNNGVLFLLLFMLIGFMALLRLANIIRHNEQSPHKALFYGCYFFIIAFFIGMFNLPVDTIFPLNLILVVCFIISLQKINVNRAQ